MVRRFAFCEKGNVLPCKSGIHVHIMNLGADISIQSSGLQYCLLERIIVHVVVGDLEEMFVVYHASMIVG